MRKVPSKCLVIDASIAKQAGGVGAPKSASKACRDFLDGVLRICHTMAWTPVIQKEWKDHAAGYARAWRVQMLGRRKLRPLEAPSVPGLQKRIVERMASEKQAEAVKKDVHLLYAALAADHQIVSMDESIRKLLLKAGSGVSELKTLGWVNPDSDPSLSLAWLEAGCPEEKSRLIKTD